MSDAKYTTAELGEKYDELNSEFRRQSDELDALDRKVDTVSKQTVEGIENLRGLITKVNYKVIQTFKEVFGDPDSGRRGLAKSHRDLDTNVGTILAMVKQGRVAGIVIVGVFTVFSAAVYNGVIRLDFLIK